MSKLGRSLLKGLRGAVTEGGDTWSLYKNKPLSERIWMVLYTTDVLDPIFNTYYSIHSFINNCQRMIEYAPLVWQHRNWDYGFVLKFNEKLHQDLYKGCYKDGHHIYTKSEERKLKTVIALYKRLHDDEYDNWQEEYFNKKYGTSEIYFTEVKKAEGKPGISYSVMRSTRDDRMTDEQKKAYLKDCKAQYKHEEYLRKQDFELLGKYIAKYSRRWWD